MTPPAGHEWDATTCRFRFDPDEHVQRAVRLVFERFLDAMNPSEIELGLWVARGTERQAVEIDRQWQLRRERVRYERTDHVDQPTISPGSEQETRQRPADPATVSA
jgi:hypothetical protein